MLRLEKQNKKKFQYRESRKTISRIRDITDIKETFQYSMNPIEVSPGASTLEQRPILTEDGSVGKGGI